MSLKRKKKKKTVKKLKFKIYYKNGITEDVYCRPVTIYTDNTNGRSKWDDSTEEEKLEILNSYWEIVKQEFSFHKKIKISTIMEDKQ